MSIPLTQFLIDTKQQFLADIRANPPKGDQWTIVIGNGAGDLDSVASSIAYAYYASTFHKLRAVPVMQINRADLGLRAENLFALSLAGIADPDSQLVFFDDVNPPTNTNAIPFPSNNFVLVDHNALDERFSVLNPSAVVTAIIDHHADEKQFLGANPRIVAPAGSCASHVAHLFPSKEGRRVGMPPELATLLLCAMLIDTGGLKPKGKALDVDHAAAKALLPVSSLAGEVPDAGLQSLAQITEKEGKEKGIHKLDALSSLTATLDKKKGDVSSFNAYDLLRRDYKGYIFTVPLPSRSEGMKINVGLSTVPLGLKAQWASDNQLLKASIEWMTNRNLSILGILTTFNGQKKGKHKRETAWIVRVMGDNSSNGLDLEELPKRLFDGLEANQELDLVLFKKFKIDVGGEKGIVARAYKQRNVKATRKAIGPALQRILEGTKDNE
ncbi:hypothetical protein AMATHDRAFT_143306 [Amanita thiersii Skay4041]|uniref:DHHA2 domain-containing protein n=1 Tax=Amanita thiersii Skay4041 TaxID=703135 RepID=A0A2A9NJN3_9AGAR|nr:hypothetical protein AMATHDRAFT_143306 [Amanita thiersii Skay4041]